MIRAYRRQWLKQHAKYENRARVVFQKEFRKVALTVPYDKMKPDNYRMLTNFYINKDAVFKAYLNVYTEVGGNHGKRVGREINKQINQKDFTVDAFLTAFQKTLADWLIRNGGQRITSVRGNFVEYINAIIAQGITKGRTMPQIASDIKKQIKSRNFYRWQALRIARTETTTASNYAATVASKVSGVLMDKVWISSQDARTRRIPESRFDHATMNQVKVHLEDPFNVNGERIMFPGATKTVEGNQSSGANVVNCRCAVAQVVRKDANGRIMRVEDKVKPRINRRDTVMSGYEKSIRNQNFESAGLYDVNGGLIFKKDGTAQSVKFSKNELNKFKGSFLTHNHPLDQSFSAEDIHVLAFHGLREIRAVTAKRTFSMTSNKQFNKMELTSLKRDITRTENKVVKELSERYYKKEITIEQYRLIGWDIVWDRISKMPKYKDIFKYTKL